MRLTRAFVAVALVSACVTPRMQVPPELARDGDVIEATDRTNVSGGLFDESFRLGPYAVTDVHRQGNATDEFGVALTDHHGSVGGYEFLLSRGRTALKATCQVGEKKRLACVCESATARALFVMGDEYGTFRGIVETGTGRHSVTSVHELEGGSNQNEPSGYRVDGNGVMGAVDVTSPGRVWFGKTLGDVERLR